MTGLDINEAFRVYFDSDANGGVRPYGMSARLATRYESTASLVEAELGRVLRMFSVPEALQHAAVGAIGECIAEQARTVQIPLAEDVCRAIGNYFAYSYK